MMTIKKHISFFIKLIVGIGLLAFLLLWDDNWKQVLSSFEDIELNWLLPFLIASLLMIAVSCLKWKMFLGKSNNQVGFGRLFSLYLIGMFFNNFMPSSVGGDVVRSYMLGKQIESQSGALASVVLERVSGFIAMVTIAILAYVFRPDLRAEPLLLISILTMGGACFVLMTLLFRPAFIDLLSPISARLSVFAKLESKLREFSKKLTLFRKESRLALNAMLLSYVFYFLATVDVYLGARLLGIECNLFELLLVTPIIMLISALPITPNGLGLWEWAFSVFIVFAGATSQEGIAVAFIIRVQNILLSVIGGLLFLLYKNKVNEDSLGENSSIAVNVNPIKDPN